MWKIIPYYAGYCETLYFFTLNAAPPGAIVKHVKLLNLHFVYMGRTVCSNKWVGVLVIVSNYIVCNNRGKAIRHLSCKGERKEHRISLCLTPQTRQLTQINRQEQRNAFRSLAHSCRIAVCVLQFILEVSSALTAPIILSDEALGLCGFSTCASYWITDGFSDQCFSFADLFFQ